MALQTFKVRREQDPVDATALVGEITPKNWRRNPNGPLPSTLPPAYVRANTWNGGTFGDDVYLAKTNVMVDDQGRGDYAPRNQDDKRIAQGLVFAVDVARPRGPIDPDEPYPTAASPAEPAPTITSLAPNTAVAGTLAPVGVVVTGTNFTKWSKLIVGGAENLSARYVSPTKMTMVMQPSISVPGVITVAAWDHGVASATSNFTYT